MLALLRKEIRSFLSSFIGYIVMAIFLLWTGLIMWAFPSDLNVLDSGYSSLDTLFVIGPWMFMFLIPSITMRAFSEEKRTGTIELLLTQPLTDFQIVMAKFLAGWLLVLFALLPTLIYFISIFFLGNPVGNIDTGGTWGSYIGLLCLGGGFVAIGTFASSVSGNQVVAFILSFFLCFFIYMGFDLIGNFDWFGRFDYFIMKLGIQEHYASVSTGALDLRDLVYFLSLITFFLLLTKTVLSSRKW